MACWSSGATQARILLCILSTGNIQEDSMPTEIELSDHCIIDHFAALRHMGPVTVPRAIRWWLLLDRKMYFTGLRGRIWRFLGVDRAVKNPNICNG